MKQVFYVHPDAPPPDAVEVREVPEPVAGPGEVVVRVQARPIDPADLLLLEGRHVFRPELPAPLGIEGAGVVDAAGPGVTLAVGARVATPWGGTWAERVVARADDLIPVPDALSIEQASMLPVNPFTAAGLLEGVPAGGVVAVSAATSAVGRMLLALARRRGVRAVAVVRSLGARDALLAGGASAVVDPGPDLAARLRAVAPGPIVRALDAVAGETAGALFDALADGGELVVYGLLSSDRVVLPAPSVVFRDLTVRGFSRRRSFAALGPARRAEVSAELAALAVEGVLDTEIEARYPLERVREALEHHLRPGRRGKILLTSEG